MGPQQRVERSKDSDGSAIPLEDGGGADPRLAAPAVAPPVIPVKPRAEVRVERAATAKCPACGSALAGGMSDTCPACGSKLLAAKRRADREIESKIDFRQALVKSLVLLAIAFGTLWGSMALMGMMDSVPMFLKVYAILIPMGVGLYAFMCAWMMGFDQPFVPAAIKIVAIYMFTDAVGALANVLPFLFLPWLFMLVSYIALSIKWLDLEIGEGTMFGGGSFVFAVLAYMGFNM